MQAVARKGTQENDPRLVAIGQRWRDIREQRGLTQEYVTERLSLSHSAYQHWEAGRNLPRMRRIVELADVLGVPVAALFREEEADTERVAHGRMAERPETYEVSPPLHPMRPALQDAGIEPTAAEALLYLADALARRSGA